MRARRGRSTFGWRFDDP